VKNKILFSILLLFICIVNVEAKSVSCEYDLIIVNVDVNKNVNIVKKDNNSSFSKDVVINYNFTYDNFVKNENGNEIYWCPVKIYKRIDKAGEEFTYGFNFGISESKTVQEVSLIGSNVNNTDNSASGPTESQKILLRTCEYSSYKVKYYDNGTAEVSFKNSTQTIDLNGKDLSKSCPDKLYISGLNGNFNASFDKKEGYLETGLTINNGNSIKNSTELEIKGVDVCLPGSTTLLVFQIIGYIIIIIKILVPIILIILGSVDLAKASISGDDKALKDATIQFVKRVLIGLIIFFIPTILDFFLGLVNGVNETAKKYEGCTDCILNPTDTDKCSPKKLNE